jgi:hypothetical protein
VAGHRLLPPREDPPHHHGLLPTVIEDHRSVVPRHPQLRKTEVVSGEGGEAFHLATEVVAEVADPPTRKGGPVRKRLQKPQGSTRIFRAEGRKDLLEHGERTTCPGGSRPGGTEGVPAPAAREDREGPGGDEGPGAQFLRATRALEQNPTRFLRKRF